MIAANDLQELPSPGAVRTASDPDSQDTRGLCPPLPKGEDGGEGAPVMQPKGTATGSFDSASLRSG